MNNVLFFILLLFTWTAQSFPLLGPSSRIVFGITNSSGGSSSYPVPGYYAFWNADLSVTTSSTKATSWTDQSANAFVLTNSAGSGPVYNSTLNGHNIMSLNDSSMTCAGFGTLTGPIEFFVVYEDTEPSSRTVILGHENANLNNSIGDNGGAFDLRANGTDYTAGTVPASTWIQVTFILNGSSSAIWTNGVLAGNLNVTGSLSWQAIDLCLLGGNSIWEMPGGCGDLLIYTNILSTANQHANEKAQDTKYGLTYSGP